MSLEYYQRVIAALPEPTLITNTSGRALAFNRPAAKLLDLANHPDLTFHLAIPEELLLTYLRRCSRNKEFSVSAFEMKTLQGDLVLTTEGCVLEPRNAEREALVLVRLNPRRNTNTRFKILHEQINKLNEEAQRRLRAEYDLRMQKKWLEVTLASIGDAVITTDTHGRVTYMNPVAEAMTGWENRQAAGQPLDDVFVVVNEETHEPVENPAARALREKRVVALANHSVLIARDGNPISIEDTAAPISTDDEVRGAVLVFHDVSERRGLEKQLLKRARTLALINQRKNEFLTMLAHELRSPLSPISNAMHILSLQEHLPSQVAEPLSIITRQVHHLRRLVDDLLDVSRITRGRMKLAKETIDLANLARAACVDFRDDFLSNGIQFSYSIPDGPVWVHADAHRLTQVLHNLMGNALKFTPSAGTVHLQFEASDKAIITLTDTGVGIDESVKPYLFEPFSQANQSLDRSVGGLGLGLALSKGITALHQGTITISSEGANKGTSVSLEFPISQPSTSPASTVQAVTVTTAKRILLIEDEKDAGDTMVEILRLLGHETHLARTGLEGLRKAAVLEPELIICDLGLPGINGFEVARRIRSNPLTNRVPLVALTGYGGSDFVQQAKDAGFQLHITKPATMDDIRCAISLAHDRQY